MTFTTMNMGEKRSSNGDFNDYVLAKANQYNPNLPLFEQTSEELTADNKQNSPKNALQKTASVFKHTINLGLP